MSWYRVDVSCEAFNEKEQLELEDTGSYLIEADTESEAKYGQSWVMQRTDPVINKPRDIDYLVPCVTNLETLEVTIYGVMKFTDIVNSDLVGEMAIAWLQKTKRALYLEDLKTLSAKKRWNLVLDI